MDASKRLEKERREIDFWATSELESPETFSIKSFVHKMAEAPILLDKLTERAAEFERADAILELGGGQGWASCILKSLYPEKRILCSDISKYALRSTPRWEEHLRARLDGVLTCRSYEIPLANESVDLVFCFQAAHHFRAHRETLAEVHRVLTDGGLCLYLYEPSCRPMIHGLATRRVNTRRPEVPEDVLVYGDMLRFGEDAGFAESAMVFSPTVANRGPIQTVYYFVLSKIAFLQGVLPCTADYRFRKAT